MNLKKALLIAFTGISLISVQAQTSQNRLALGLQVGLSEYSGDLGNGFGQFSLKSRPVQGTTKGSNPGFSGLTLAYYLNSNVDLTFTMNYGEWGYYLTDDNSFNTRFRSNDLSIRYKVFGDRFKKIQPYLSFGIGSRNISRIDSVIYHKMHDFDSNHQAEINLLAGIGFKLNVHPKITITIQSIYGLTNNDQAEGKPYLEHYAYDQFLNHSIGLHYQINPIQVHNKIHETVSKWLKK